MSIDDKIKKIVGNALFVTIDLYDIDDLLYQLGVTVDNDDLEYKLLHFVEHLNDSIMEDIIDAVVKKFKDLLGNKLPDYYDDEKCN